jgi:2-hydroxychromene-2-carboxylate isomerase
MKTIDYYFSLMSPFTYLAGLRLEEIAARRGAVIRYKPINTFELFPQTGGVPPAKRHWSRQEYRLQELKRISKALGMPINLQPAHWPADATLAAGAVISAQEAGSDAGVLAHALLRAVWSEERDISDPETVRDIVSSCGISWDAIEPGLDAARAAYEENAREAVERGVFGSPFYCVGDERFWGQDRLSWLDDYLAQVGDA